MRGIASPSEWLLTSSCGLFLSPVVRDRVSTVVIDQNSTWTTGLPIRPWHQFHPNVSVSWSPWKRTGSVPAQNPFHCVYSLLNLHTLLLFSLYGETRQYISSATLCLVRWYLVLSVSVATQVKMLGVKVNIRNDCQIRIGSDATSIKRLRRTTVMIYKQSSLSLHNSYNENQSVILKQPRPSEVQWSLGSSATGTRT